MASMTSSYMRERWPGVFADAPSLPAIDPLDEAIIAAQNQLSVENLNQNYTEAVVLLAGHFALLGTPARASGANKYKAGLVELGFGTAGAAMDSTSFLSLYKALLKRSPRLRVPT